MRMIGLTLVLTLLAGVVLTGCGEDGLQKRDVGAVLGGVGGGVLGSQFGKGSGKTASTIVGALAGAALGGYIGNQMDENDRHKVSRALEVQPDNRPLPWRNPNTNRSYEVTPTRTWQENSGQYCREYATRVWIDGREETAYGKACRQPDGSWRVQE